MSNPDAAMIELLKRMQGQSYDRDIILPQYPTCPLDDLDAIPLWLNATFGAKNASGGIDVLGWQVYNLREAFKPRPPLQYLIEGTYYLPSLNCVYAPPGTLKTMLLLDQAVCVAGGLDWLIPLPGKDTDTARKTQQAAVFWVDCDNGPRPMAERLEALARARSLPLDIPLHYTSMPSPWLDISNWPNVERLTKRIKALGAKFVILDNLRNICGGVDENAADMGTVMANLRRLTEDTQAVVVVIHHQRKDSGGRQKRAGDTLRGHSSIEAALDLALLIDRNGQNDSITIKATKTRGVDILPFGALFTYTHKPNSTELAEARFFGVEVENVVTQTTIRRAIACAVDKQPGMTQSKLIDAVQEALKPTDGEAPPGKSRIRDEVLNMAARGKISAQKGERGAILYSPPDAYQVAMSK